MGLPTEANCAVHHDVKSLCNNDLSYFQALAICGLCRSLRYRRNSLYRKQ